MNEYQPHYRTFHDVLAARHREHQHNDWSRPIADTENGVPVLRRYCLTPACWFQRVTFETAGQDVDRG
jgi:hypothetical protein